MAKVDYDLKSSLCVIKGIGKRGEYQFLTVRRRDAFNNLIVDIALQEGVELIDLTPKKK